MKVIGNWMAVRQHPPHSPETSLFIPEPLKAVSYAGDVVDKGNKVDVNVGDTVVFGKFAYNEIEVDGEKLLFVHESEVSLTFRNK